VNNIHNIHNKKENKAKLQVYIYKVSRIQIHRTRIKVQGTDLLRFGENVVLSKIIKIYSQSLHFLVLKFQEEATSPTERSLFKDTQNLRL
jgi:hypothetical protein